MKNLYPCHPLQLLIPWCDKISTAAKMKCLNYIAMQNSQIEELRPVTNMNLTCTFSVSQSILILSSPELKPQVSFFDRLSSVDWPSVRRSVNFSHFHLLSRTIGPISTKLGTKHPWIKVIQVCSNEGSQPFQRGDNYGISKIHWRNLKISSPEPLGQFKPNLAQGIQGNLGLVNWRATPFFKKIISK